MEPAIGGINLARRTRAANQAVIKAGGPTISTHVHIDPNDAKSWIDRLIDREKAKTPVEFAWQRAHYESTKDLIAGVVETGPKLGGKYFIRLSIDKPKRGYRSLNTMATSVSGDPHSKLAAMQQSIDQDNREPGMCVFDARWNEQRGMWQIVFNHRDWVDHYHDWHGYGGRGFFSNWVSKSDVISSEHKIKINVGNVWLLTGSELPEKGADGVTLLDPLDFNVEKKLDWNEFYFPGVYDPAWVDDEQDSIGARLNMVLPQKDGTPIGMENYSKHQQRILHLRSQLSQIKMKHAATKFSSGERVVHRLLGQGVIRSVSSGSEPVAVVKWDDGKTSKVQTYDLHHE